MKDRVALITGGASGIGRAIAERLARRGARVVLADRQVERARELAAALEAEGGAAHAAELDVRDAAAFADVAEQTRERHGRIDYLFNNAGIAIGGAVADYDQAAWDDVLDVNLRGVVHGIQAVYPMMLERGSGHIVNTASMAGLLPLPNGVGYAASKHAVVGLSRSLRIEAASRGVRVSVLCPGAIRTPILAGGEFGRHVGRKLTDEKVAEFWERLRPMEASAFAREVLKDVDANVATIIVPRWWKAFWMLDRLTPGLSSRTWAYAFRRSLRVLDAQDRDAPASAATHPAVHAE